MANYAATIVSTSLAESKEKHTPSVRMMVMTTRNLDDDTEVQKKFVADLWLSEKTAEKTVQTLRDLGFTGQTLIDLNFPDTMAGLECEISTEMSEYNGQTSEKVRFVNKPGSFANRGLRSASDDMARSISQRYDAVLRTGKYHKPPQKGPAYGQQRVSPQQAQQWPSNDTSEFADDPPF